MTIAIVIIIAVVVVLLVLLGGGRGDYDFVTPILALAVIVCAIVAIAALCIGKWLL